MFVWYNSLNSLILSHESKEKGSCFIMFWISQLRIKIAAVFDKVNNEFSSPSLTVKHCVVTSYITTLDRSLKITLSKKKAGPVQDHFKIRWFINRFKKEINRKVLLRFSSPAGIALKCLHWTSLLLIAAVITQQIHSVNPLSAISQAATSSNGCFLRIRSIICKRYISTISSLNST